MDNYKIKILEREIAMYEVAQPVPNDNQTYIRGYRAGLEHALRLMNEQVVEQAPQSEPGEAASFRFVTFKDLWTILYPFRHILYSKHDGAEILKEINRVESSYTGAPKKNHGQGAE